MLPKPRRRWVRRGSTSARTREASRSRETVPPAGRGGGRRELVAGGTEGCRRVGGCLGKGGCGWCGQVTTGDLERNGQGQRVEGVVGSEGRWGGDSRSKVGEGARGSWRGEPRLPARPPARRTWEDLRSQSLLVCTRRSKRGPSVPVMALRLAEALFVLRADLYLNCSLRWRGGLGSKVEGWGPSRAGPELSGPEPR